MWLLLLVRLFYPPLYDFSHTSVFQGAMVSDLTLFDITDENLTDYEQRVEKLATVSSSLQNKIYRLKKDVKDRKFKHNPDLLDEDVISCSQFSVLQSSQEEEEEQQLSQQLSQQSITADSGRPSTYR